MVTFHFDDADYTVEIDAYTGEVWDSFATYNDGSTQTFRPQGDDDTNEGTSEQTSTNDTAGMISSGEASNIAVNSVAYGNNVSNLSAQLVTGGDAPHYVVTFHFDDADYTVEVDAYTGEVWDSYATYNDGTVSRDNDDVDNDNDHDNDIDYSDQENEAYDDAE